ncbi:hypothetical protein AVEN_82893-1 [Araneus ventricosus]|uniref:Uncharacterized protein n=1 Tax=Araneus ventricosus TaxID=182803 RepID=A0A4Y2JZF2_ARAVE|nr:hypothetical protein AVEN_82893-1 [Araneus ventricosus]
MRQKFLTLLAEAWGWANPLSGRSISEGTEECPPTHICRPLAHRWSATNGSAVTWATPLFPRVCHELILYRPPKCHSRLFRTGGRSKEGCLESSEETGRKTEKSRE